MHPFSQSRYVYNQKNRSKWAVVNLDDRGPPIWFKDVKFDLDVRYRKPADLMLREWAGWNGTDAIVEYTAKQWLPGGHYRPINAYNCLAAIAVLLTKGFALQNIVDVLKLYPPYGPSRTCINQLGCTYTSISPTPTMLGQYTEKLVELRKSRLISVFGCGGDRDVTKRLNGEVSERYADFTIVTSDNHAQKILKRFVVR